MKMVILATFMRVRLYLAHITRLYSDSHISNVQ